MVNVIIIGSDDDNDVVVPGILPHHLKIENSGDGSYVLEAYEGANDIYVNGDEVNGIVVMSPSDVLQVGGTDIQWYECFESDADNKSVEYYESESGDDGIGGGMIFSLLISVGLIIAGLSGNFVLRGTNSSTALVVAGIIFLIIDIVRIAIKLNKK